MLLSDEEGVRGWTDVSGEMRIDDCCSVVVVVVVAVCGRCPVRATCVFAITGREHSIGRSHESGEGVTDVVDRRSPLLSSALAPEMRWSAVLVFEIALDHAASAFMAALSGDLRNRRDHARIALRVRDDLRAVVEEVEFVVVKVPVAVFDGLEEGQLLWIRSCKMISLDSSESIAAGIVAVPIFSTFSSAIRAWRSLASFIRFTLRRSSSS